MTEYVQDKEALEKFQKKIAESKTTKRTAQVSLEVDISLPDIETDFDESFRSLAAIAALFQDGTIISVPVDGPKQPDTICYVKCKSIEFDEDKY
jgi:6-phosphogluconate dehydrogenase (decarboxylating)